MRAVLVLIPLFLASFSGCAQPDSDAAAPTWRFTDLDGVTHSRDTPPGNATVLFFMATWCSSCRTKAPMLAHVHGDYADEGVRFYSLDVDPTETDAQIRAWQARYAQPWPHGVDRDLSVQRAFGIASQSSVVVLDAAGVPVRAWGYGAVTGDGLRAALDEALSRAAATSASAAPTAKGTATPA